MGIFDRIRQRAGKPAVYRLTPPLEPGALELWGEVLVSAPTGTRVSAGVVIDLIVEEENGRALPEEVAGYVVPYVVFSSGGVPLWAFVRDEDAGIAEFLRAAGLEVRTLGQLRSGRREVQAGDTSVPLRENAEEGGKVGSKVAEDGAEEPVNAGSGEEHGGEATESTSGDEEGGLEEDFARAFWEGRVGAAEALKAVSQAPAIEPLDPPFVVYQASRAESAKKGGERKEGVPACPKCGAPMVLKTARRGKRAGKKFWSCSRFPECKGTRPYREEA